MKRPDGTIDEGALKDNMERTAAMEMDYFAQILVGGGEIRLNIFVPDL